MKFDKILFLIARRKRMNNEVSLNLTPSRKGDSQRKRLSLVKWERGGLDLVGEIILITLPPNKCLIIIQ